MRILRSQYLELQNNVGRQYLFKNDGTEKPISNKVEKHAKCMEMLNAVQAPTVTLCKKNIGCFKATTSSNPTNIRISINNFDESLEKLKVVVEFTNMDALWLTRVYKSYENDFWRKKPRLSEDGTKKWSFFCGFCNNVYKEFVSMKSHLNLHFDIYPYVCKSCGKKYTNRKSATTHLKKVHQFSNAQWNDFLTS